MRRLSKEAVRDAIRSEVMRLAESEFIDHCFRTKNKIPSEEQRDLFCSSYYAKAEGDAELILNELISACVAEEASELMRGESLRAETDVQRILNKLVSVSAAKEAKRLVDEYALWVRSPRGAVDYGAVVTFLGAVVVFLLGLSKKGCASAEFIGSMVILIVTAVFANIRPFLLLTKFRSPDKRS